MRARQGASANLDGNSRGLRSRRTVREQHVKLNQVNRAGQHHGRLVREGSQRVNTGQHRGCSRDRGPVELVDSAVLGQLVQCGGEGVVLGVEAADGDVHGRQGEHDKVITSLHMRRVVDGAQGDVNVVAGGRMCVCMCVCACVCVCGRGRGRYGGGGGSSSRRGGGGDDGGDARELTGPERDVNVVAVRTGTKPSSN